jgi:signal transduction histidine kinase
MEETIRQSRAFLQTVIDAIPDVLLVIGTDYRIVLANRAAREMAGGIDPTVGWACHQLSHHRDLPCAGKDEPCPLRQVIASKIPVAVTHTHYDAEGKPFFVEVTAAPVLNETGEVDYVIEACRDITDRKRAEEALQKAHDELEDEVQRRTAELAKANEDLRGKEVAGQHLLEKLISAHEEERARIARELHDDAGQSLAALVLRLGSLEATLPADAEDAKRQVIELQGFASSIVEEVRRLMRDLRPSLLDDLGLIAAISSFAERQLTPADVQFTIDVQGKKRKLAQPLETVLFRIFQEAINNIAKHAQANNGRIELRFKDRSVEARITDDGRGFDPVSSHTTWQTFGLLGIEERVAILGGTLRIESQEGQGTQIRFEVPAPIFPQSPT